MESLDRDSPDRSRRYALGSGGLNGAAGVFDGSPGFQVDTGQHGCTGRGFFGMAGDMNRYSKMLSDGIDQ